MARQFGSYSPVVPLGTTWEESIVLEDEHGTPIDLTGYQVRAQLRATIPTLASGSPTTQPIFELTTAGYYATAPAWPVIEGFSVPTPTNGTILLLAPAAQFTPLASPTNAKTKLVWDIRLVNGSGYTIPVVSGAVVFLPARTV